MATTHNLYLNSHDLADAMKAAVLFINTSNYETVHSGDCLAGVCLRLNPATNTVDVVGMSSAAAYRKKLEAFSFDDTTPSLPDNQLLIPWEVVSILLKYTPRRSVRAVSHFEITIPDGNTNRQEVKFTGPDGSSHIFQTLGMHYPDYASLFAKGLKMKEEPQTNFHFFALMPEQIKRLAKMVGKTESLNFYFGEETFCYIEHGEAEMLLSRTVLDN